MGATILRSIKTFLRNSQEIILKNYKNTGFKKIFEGLIKRKC